MPKIGLFFKFIIDFVLFCFALFSVDNCKCEGESEPNFLCQNLSLNA